MYRLGDRANNGRYDLIEPSGAVIPGKGIKVFNGKVNTGDPVKVYQRTDGIYIIQGRNAIKNSQPKDPLDIPTLQDNCGGYLLGQIFNCGGEEKDIISAWALGTFPFAGGALGVRLINLISGAGYFLTSIPGTVQPCTPGNPPPGNPPQAPPTQGSDQTYIHVWVQPGNFQPAFSPPHCSINPPVPTRPDTEISNSTTVNLVHPISFQSWFFRSTIGIYSDLPPGDPNRGWGVNSLAVLTNDPAPPPIPTDVTFPVVSTGYIEYNNSAFLTPIVSGSASSWVYASGACGALAYDPNANPGQNPNYNRQPPPATPIPNQHEMTLSLDNAGNPIAFIRHSPSCVKPNDWSFQRSYRIVNNEVRNYLGKLLEDWRYTVPSFTCQSTFATDTFTNLAPELVQLWTIDPDDRPATIEANDPPSTLPIKNKGIVQENCSTNDIKTLEIQAQAQDPGTVTFTITSIAVRSRKQKY